MVGSAGTVVPGDIEQPAGPAAPGETEDRPDPAQLHRNGAAGSEALPDEHEAPGSEPPPDGNEQARNASPDGSREQTSDISPDGAGPTADSAGSPVGVPAGAPVAEPVVRARRFEVVRNRSLLTLALGHLTVDMYTGLLPMMYPLLAGQFSLDLKTVGMVTLAYGSGSSLSQPLFGWLADRYGTRYIGLALSWTAISFSLLGFVPNFGVLLLLAALSGIGSGAYHPMGALNASRVISDKNRNAAMSIYTTGGTLGVALGPLIGILTIGVFGLRGTIFMLIPGLLIAAVLLVEMRSISVKGRRAAGQANLIPPPIPIGPISVVVGVMMLRAWTTFGLQAFIPLWYSSLGYEASFYGLLATTLILSSAVGAIGAGTLADRFGRRVIILVSALMSVPTIFLFASFTGPVAFLLAALIGLLGASTAPLLLVTAQQLMVGRAGMASGLILGLGFVMGAVGVPILGAVGDAYGIQTAMRLLAFIAAAAAVLAAFLPSEAAVRTFASRQSRPAPESPDGPKPNPA